MVAAVAHIQGVKREVQLLQPKKHVRDLDFTKKHVIEVCTKLMSQIDTNGNQHTIVYNSKMYKTNAKASISLYLQ